MYLNYQFFEVYIEENDNDQEYLNSQLYNEQLKYVKIIIISYTIYSLSNSNKRLNTGRHK
jgi:hypothetical protein